MINMPFNTDEIRSPAAVRRRIEAMEQLLEGMFVIPGTKQRVGLDVILDVIPVAGDLVGALLGAWMVWEARNLGMSKWQMTRMAGNVGIDTLLGAIPFVGAIPDFFFRSNSRNLRIIRRHLDRHHPGQATIEGQVVPLGTASTALVSPADAFPHPDTPLVIPADAGIHDTVVVRSQDLWVPWIPTIVGMTGEQSGGNLEVEADIRGWR